MSRPDPCEQIIRDALAYANIPFQAGHENAARLDFYLPLHDVYIEVKQFHSDRLTNQMARARNVIAVQGKDACELMAKMIRGWP